MYESVKTAAIRAPDISAAIAKNFCVETEADVKSNMAGYEGESERMWDEYDWERFLREQDQKTEKYMQLLEKYLDDPQRDEIIAREMRWTQMLDAKDRTPRADAIGDAAPWTDGVR